jgi:hypothetical protein
MTVDLVVRPSDYLQELTDQITSAVYALSDPDAFDRPGGVFIRQRDLLSAGELFAFRTASRAHIVCDGRPLSRILASLTTPEEPSGEPEDASPPAEPARDRRAGERRTLSGASGPPPPCWAPRVVAARPTSDTA